jgi:hypothetical protein
MKSENWTVLIISPSTIWKRRFGAIDLIKVGTTAFNPIVETENAQFQDISFFRDSVFVNLDKKYSYVKNAWFESILDAKGHLLLEVKYRNGRKIKHFTSTVLSHIYEFQEKAIAKNPDYKHHYLVVLEEIQNSFGSYSMNTDDSLDLMTIFTQSRSDAQIHYIGIGQRLNDISTKLIERLRPFIGLTLGECSLRKLKAMIPDSETKKRIQNLPQRHWIYLDGKTNPEIVIAEYKKEGSPNQLKQPIIEQPQPKHKSLLRARLEYLFNFGKMYENINKPTKTTNQNSFFEKSEEENENEEMDDLTLLSEDLLGDE